MIAAHLDVDPPRIFQAVRPQIALSGPLICSGDLRTDRAREKLNDVSREGEVWTSGPIAPYTERESDDRLRALGITPTPQPPPG